MLKMLLMLLTNHKVGLKCVRPKCLTFFSKQVPITLKLCISDLSLIKPKLMYIKNSFCIFTFSIFLGIFITTSHKANLSTVGFAKAHLS